MALGSLGERMGAHSTAVNFFLQRTKDPSSVILFHGRDLAKVCETVRETMAIHGGFCSQALAPGPHFSYYAEQVVFEHAAHLRHL